LERNCATHREFYWACPRDIDAAMSLLLDRTVATHFIHGSSHQHKSPPLFTSAKKRVLEIPLNHNVEDQGRPPAKGMSADAHALLVVVLLPEEARAVVLAQHGAQDVGAKVAVELEAALLLRPGLQAVVLQGAKGQKVDVYPNGASARG